MIELSATIRLRPTRIRFLVRPNDLASVLKIMRACCCLWGGIYNPIIPVSRKLPADWSKEPYRRMTGSEIARGYVDFFEPDVFVEAQRGLLEEAGLGALKKEHSIHPEAISLREFLAKRDGKSWAEPAYGANITEVLNHIYETEQQFQPRNQRHSVVIKEEVGNGALAAVFGTYPKQAAPTTSRSHIRMSSRLGKSLQVPIAGSMFSNAVLKLHSLSQPMP